MGNLANLEELEQDQQAQDAIVRTIAVIGAAANRIQKVAPEFVTAHPELPWIQMRGIRNKVIHDYFDVAWDVVWNTVQDHLPTLLRQVRPCLDPLTEPEGVSRTGFNTEAVRRSGGVPVTN